MSSRPAGHRRPASNKHSRWPLTPVGTAAAVVFGIAAIFVIVVALVNVMAN